MLFLRCMLHVNNISFRYNDKDIAIKDISFNAGTGEHISIIGESGSGKTTLLKLLYGEFDLDQGTIHWKDQEILGPKFNLIAGPEYMKHVSQEFDLMPYTTVSENVGKFLSNFYPEEKQRRIQELLEVVELMPFANTKAQFLSGGQKQRAALARAIAKQPEILLLDEPFSHIDNFKKQSLRRNFFGYLKDKGITCIVATHDKDDVLSYADTIIALQGGEMLVKNTPQSLHDNPEHAMIASFFGEYNTLKLSDILTESSVDTPVIVYAHEFSVVDNSNILVRVVECFYEGSHYLLKSEFRNKPVFFISNKPYQIGDKVFLEVPDAVIKKRTAG